MVHALLALCGTLLHVHLSQQLSASGVNVITVAYTEAYHTSCGGWWRRSTCTKHRTAYRLECHGGYRSTDNYGCPWPICDHHIDPSGACNVYYANSHIIYSSGSKQHNSGGSCTSPEQCSGCNEGFYSTPNRCWMCSAINNCDLETCTSASNQVCSRCEGVVLEKPGHRAYAASSNKKACIKACSWRPDSTRCYPGTCATEHASGCRCMQEFSGTHCDTIDTYPSIMYSMLKLFGPGLEMKEAPGDPNEGSPQERSWTNINDSRRIHFKFTSKFIPTSPLPLPSPAYIEHYAVGIIQGVVEFTVYRDGEAIKKESYVCTGVNESSPNQAVFSCDQELPASALLQTPVISGDILEFRFMSTNGGQVKVRNQETGILNTFPFAGKTKVHTFSLGIDFTKPLHCSQEENSTCTQEMLTVPVATAVRPVQISWRGWLDDVGVHVYNVAVYELVDRNTSDNNSRLHDKSQVQSARVYSPVEASTLDIATAGAYGIVLTAYDEAENYRSARRIFIFDETSKVETVEKSGLVVTTAARESQYTWQWHTGPVTIDWNLRYINPLHDGNKWLKGVAPVPDVELQYDDNAQARGVEAVANVQGIVEYQSAFQTDHEGGRSLTSPPPDSEWSSQSLHQQQTISPVLQDGDTVRFWIRAFDIRRELLEEHVTLHIDTSPPVIENLWLTLGDRLNVSVHNEEDFSKMTFEWNAHDIHSGLETVSWRLFDNFTGEDILHGTDRLSPRGEAESLEECEELYGDYARGASCYCTPGMGCYHRHYQVTPAVTSANLSHGGVFLHMRDGVHNSDYFLEVTVMNQAKLYTTVDFQLTVDSSAPTEGHVQEGMPRQLEVDYQQDLHIHAHWAGFFDRESGVKFYQYSFSTACLTADNFGLDLEVFDVKETYSTHASWSAPSPGTYFVSVVAYNSALVPSRPVCSDGVTVDHTPPFLSHVAIRHAKVPAGLVKSTSGHVWFIDSSRRKSEIKNSDVTCSNKGTLVEDVVLANFPFQYYANGTTVTQEASVCSTAAPFVADFFTTIFLASKNELYVNWTGVDEDSGIYDYELGLLSDASDDSAPDILPFTSTHHHPHFQTSHPLLDQAKTFYIALRATNKAGLSSTKVIGPVIVHTLVPSFTGSITTRLDGEYLIAQWEASAFTDPEPDHLKYEVAVGTNLLASVVRPFQAIESGGSCVLSGPPTCAAVPVSGLNWDLHHSHTYFLSVRVTNLVGLSAVARSEPYLHDVRLPAQGVVIDVCPQDEEHIFNMNHLRESDFQLSTVTLKARWFGFSDGVLSVTYKAGIGTKPGLVNIRKYEDIGGRLQHKFTNLLLNASQTYHVCVVATSGGGKRTVCSDGVTILTERTPLPHVTLRDGLPCNTTGRQEWIPQHENMGVTEACGEDATYQSSRNVLSAHWDWGLDAHFSEHFPDVHWRLEKKLPYSDDFWHEETTFEYTASKNQLVVTGVSLDAGSTYRLALQFCAVYACSLPVHSSGVTVLSNPPVVGLFALSYTARQIEVRMARFYDPDVPVESEAYQAVDRYEWAVTNNAHDKRTITRWARLEGLHTTQENQMTFQIALPDHLAFSKCLRLAVRGFNKMNQYSVVSADIQNCSARDPAFVNPNIVLDAVGFGKIEGKGYPVFLEKNEAWNFLDADYTGHTNMLSGVWPRLRHGNYKWAVMVSEQSDPLSVSSRQSIMALADPCTASVVLQCGHTEDEFVNVEMRSPLVHGSRYYICIHAGTMHRTHEKWTQDLPEVTACSDGVTVDTTPPRGGRVIIGGLLGRRYQTKRSEMEVHWDSFTDVEEGGLTPNPSGISHYTVALGTTPGGGDVAPSQAVGLVNHLHLNHLQLHEGTTVYAIVTAFDYVNKTTAVVSDGLIIDYSPPRKTGSQISVNGQYITSSTFEACWWEVLIDTESGMGWYQVSVGSRPGRDDLLDFQSLTGSCRILDLASRIRDGDVIYISVKGYNNAGLHTVLTSRALVVDMSAPRKGFVYDGKLSLADGGVKDKDYVTNRNESAAHWEGFTDPHSSISHFLVRMGTCPGCEDLMPQHNVGAKQEVSFPAVQTEGRRHFVEVRACNLAGLCSSVSSDGFLLDESPPVRGSVMDGTSDRDIQFQASRTFLGCKYVGFSDPESGLHHYEWRVGTSPGADDILSPTNSGLHELAFHTLSRDRQLPVGQKLYTTVRAYNKAGLYSESSSNGFLVDDSPPAVVREPVKQNQLEGANTSFTRTALTVGWQFTDSQSTIQHHYLSISSHQLGEFDSSTLKVPGFLQEHTFVDLDLHDGSRYQVKVTACNIAGLCSSASTTDILLDSSPPSSGALAMETDHAARLTRHLAGWMTWSPSALRLAWLGFSDLHSGVDHYIVSVGSREFASDLNLNGKYRKVLESDSGPQKNDEGRVQLFEVEIEDVSALQFVFVSIWAVNGVGLKSSSVHSQLELVPGGDLQLVRRCQPFNCAGTCVCGVQDDSCLSPTTNCRQFHGQATTVRDRTGQHNSSAVPDDNYSCFSNFIGATWSSDPPVPQYYEVAAGDSTANNPEGVFDSVTGRVWYDVGQSTSAIIPLPRGNDLITGHSYSVFVKSWYSDTSFCVDKSDGITIISSPPEITKATGVSVKEVYTASSTKDLDYQVEREKIHLTWTSTFLSPHHTALSYRVYIGTSPGAHDTHVSEELRGTRYTARGLSLESNTVYYSSVLARTETELLAWAVSDGVQLDLLPPNPGLVFDGTDGEETDFQGKAEWVFAHWLGFWDLDSAVAGYYWCVGTSIHPDECSVIQWQGTGLHTFASRPVHALQSGTTIWNKVYAVDEVGHQSEVVISNGVTVDISPPEAQRIVYLGENVLRNPSFEDNSETVNYSWTRNEPNYFETVRTTESLAQDGDAYAVVSGSIYQSLSDLHPGQQYRVTLYTGYEPAPLEEDKVVQAFLAVDEERFTFSHDPNLCVDVCSVSTQRVIMWNKHTFLFMCTNETVTLTVGTVSTDMRMVLDEVSVQMVDYVSGEETDSHLVFSNVYLQHWSSLHVSWHFQDLQSPITQYQWAVGLVEGGSQLLNFTNVGRTAHGRVSGLKLAHGWKLHVTVLAINAAGLTSVTHSDYITVDMTPPVIHVLNDGLQSDVDYIVPEKMSANWVVFDEESQISHCDWAIGSREGQHDVKGYERVAGTESAVRRDMKDQLTSPGLRVYTTLRCVNKAGLAAIASSDGVYVYLNTLNTSGVGFQVLDEGTVLFSEPGVCHKDIHKLRVRWDGEQAASLKTIIVHLGGENMNFGYDITTSLMYSICKFTGYEMLESGVYTVSATPRDRLDELGRVFSRPLHMTGTPPRISDRLGVTVTAGPDGVTVLSWRDVFTSPWNVLTYEVRVGRVKGSADVVEGLVTHLTRVTLALPNGPPLFLSLIAVDPCGLTVYLSQSLR